MGAQSYLKGSTLTNTNIITQCNAHIFVSIMYVFNIISRYILEGWLRWKPVVSMSVVGLFNQ